VGCAQISDLAQRRLTRVRQFFETLNRRLDGRAFVAGEAFGVVDLTAVGVVDFARVVKVMPCEAHPHLLRWCAAMALRPPVAL
jgi:glutathione S-transferase